MGYRNKGLPDTPWHVGFVKKDENDNRRHKSRCIHIKDNICNCNKSGCFLLKCEGSAHCKYYNETEDEWDQYLEDMKTEEDRANDRADKRQMAIIEKAIQLLKDPSYDKRIKLRASMTKCPICSEKLHRTKASKTVGGCFSCSYCKAKFQIVDKNDFAMIEEAKNEHCFVIKV